MKRRILFLSLGVLIALLFATCRKKESFPPEPIIEYESFTRFGEDSAYVKIKFTDGDGDIGLDPTNTSPPYNSGSEYYNNAYVYYYYKNPSGNFVLFDPIDITPGNYFKFPYRMPVITPDKKDKALKGEMVFRLDFPYHVHDTVQYEVYIYDRALNKSNVVKTDIIIF